MPSIESSLNLDEETISDLLYFSRVSDLQELKDSISEICKTQKTREIDVLAAAVDEETGNLCSHYAAANGHLAIIQYIAALCAHSPITEKLSILARQNLSGNSPVHWAALNGHLEVVKHIVGSLTKEAQAILLTCKNNAGHDAAFEAEGNEQTEVVSYLLSVLDETDNETAAIDASASRHDDFEEEVRESVIAEPANGDSEAQIEGIQRDLNNTEPGSSQNR